MMCKMMCNLRRKKEKPYSFSAEIEKRANREQRTIRTPSNNFRYKMKEERNGMRGGNGRCQKKKRIAARGALGNILAELKAAGNGLPAYSNAPAGCSSPVEAS